MLVELHVRNLGVIADLTLELGAGMTALTGETGAGKTLLIEAIQLLLGERADSVLVRPGADEARVEGRFAVGEDDLVLARVVPRAARSRAYVDGRLASVGELAEAGRRLVDLHGQHAHQSLLEAKVQRRALDRFASVDTSVLKAARARLAALDAELAAVGGDARTRAREVDMLRFQLTELVDADLADANEDDGLAAEEKILAMAGELRRSGIVGADALTGEGGAADSLHDAVAALSAGCGMRVGRNPRPGRGREVGSAGESNKEDCGLPFDEFEARLRSLIAEVEAVAVDLRTMVEAISEDDERAAAVRSRRQLLRTLRRKYGERLADVMKYEAECTIRLAELLDIEGRGAILEDERAEAVDRLGREAARVRSQRQAAGPRLAAAIEGHLRTLALPRARVGVAVEGDEGEAVELQLSANAGEELLALTKVASGGELARTMLAARLVLTEAPATLVFDEVDAGIGGEAALAVGRSLAQLGSHHQVLVVTHLPQVAAFADAQVAVTKSEHAGRTVASARLVEGEDRTVELSRMLSGHPDSQSARIHAAELLALRSRGVNRR